MKSGSIVREIWERVPKPELARGEVLELVTWDGESSLARSPETWEVCVAKHKPGQFGKGKEWTTKSVTIPVRPWMAMNPPRLYELVYDHLKYLAGLFALPPKPPKGWRLFSRRPK